MSEENHDSSFSESMDALGEIDVVEPNLDQAKPPSSSKKPVKRGRLIAVAVIALAVLAYGYKTWQYNSAHVLTDDAYVTSDLVPVNSTISGSVKSVNVTDNQHVNVGDILVELDSAARQADVDQAEANLAAAKAAAGGATADVQLAAQTGSAQISQAQEAISLVSSDIAVAQANAQKAASNVITAQANIAKTKSDAAAASATIDARRSALRRAKEQLVSLKTLIASAEANLKASEANLASARAISANAERDAKRAETLQSEGAGSAATTEAKETAAATARSAVDSAQQQVDVARALVAQRKAEYSTAQEQIKEADAGVTQAIAQQASANNSIAASRALEQEAKSGLVAAKEAVSAAGVRRSQAEGKLRETEASLKKVTVSENGRETALARVKQAAAALETARINLANTKIKALVTGIISMKMVQLGQQVAPGQEMMAIIPVAEPWVVANFKETQLAEIRPGLPVEIEVDAIPGVKYAGHVDSISRGTGATFALIPPDNATGNFTKVVQRVPVKIVLEPGQQHLDKLRAGLSSKVAVSLRG